MKKIFARIFACLFAAVLAGGAFYLASCSSQAENDSHSSGGGKASDADVDVDIEVDFNTLILAFDSTSKKATAAGLPEGATYAWALDSSANSEAISANGAECSLDFDKISVGNHTLLVVGTYNGIDYSANCTIKKE